MTAISPVEAEKNGECPMGSVVMFGGEQEPAEFTAIHGVLFGGWDLGSGWGPSSVLVTALRRR